MQFLPKVLPHVYGAGKAVSFLFRNDRLVKHPNKETLEHFMYNRKYTKVSDLLTFFSKKAFFRLSILILCNVYHVNCDGIYCTQNVLRLKQKTKNKYTLCCSRI